MEYKRARSKSTLRWLLKHSGKSLYVIAAITLGSSVMSASGIVSTLVFKEIVDSAVAGEGKAFFLYMLILAGILVFQTLLSAVIGFLDEAAWFGLVKTFKTYLYHRLMHAEYAHLGTWHTGELMNYLNGDVEIIADGMTGIFPGLMSMLVKLAGASAVLFLWDWRFCVIYAAGGIVILAVSFVLRRIMKRMHKEVREQYDDLQSYQQETIENMMIMRAFRAEKTGEHALQKRLHRLQKIRMKRTVFSNLCTIGFNSASDLGYLLGLVWCGAGIIRGSISYGTLSAVVQLTGQIQQPFADITSYLPRYYALSASAERLMKINGLPKEKRYSEEEIAGILKKYEQEANGLQIEDLSFSYGREPVLRHASLLINKGDIMAFTGISGSGKSTFLKLLLALYQPETGGIFLSGTDSGRIAVSPDTRGIFALVPQGNFLMSGTIYEAVSFFSKKQEFSETEKSRIREACRIACADTFIREMPDQYETVIREHGAGLSEGQLQRLAIARAVFTDAPILLLDEATSALDEATEQQVLQNIKNLTGKTVLLVTHRKKALSICNRVVRIADMRFTEEAIHD